MRKILLFQEAGSFEELNRGVENKPQQKHKQTTAEGQKRV